MMKRIIFAYLLLAGTLAFGQEKFTISGTIKDAENGEDLFGVNVSIVELPGVGTASNEYGFYSLTVEAGEYTVMYSYLGYESFSQKVSLQSDQKIPIELSTGAEQLEELVVTGEKKDENVTSSQMGTVDISPTEIENVPVLFGEKDVIKVMQLMPGVQAAGEGNSGFFVRGGSADQNLILLDGAPVYNASHLLGFFSVFNSDALKNVNLIKGNMPAEYGGRLSSVMDIKMKEGNTKKLGISGGLGLISSKLTVEAPIKKDKGAFIISGRRTYADLFLKLSKDENQRNSILYFYDLNAKANYTLGENDRLFISGYFGRDNFGFGDQFGFDWGNATGTLRWNHIYSNKLFSNTSVIYSHYNYKIGIAAGGGIDIGSAINDINIKQDYQFFASDKHNIRFGLNAIHHTFAPGELKSQDANSFNNTKLQDRYSWENAVYVSNEHKVTSRLTLNYGLRYSMFVNLGEGDFYSYDKNGNVIDTASYGKNEVVQYYGGFEPRISGNFLLDDVSSIKAAYARTNQYIHLLSNSTTSTPTDVWMPSSNNIKPQIGDQVSLGYFRNFKSNEYEFSLEGYFKKMDNVIDYKTGAQTTLNETVEGELLYGEGQAYGLEFFLKKRTGDFTGWVSYTWSHSDRKFEELNDGNWFPARQDRTHDISLVGMYQINDRMMISGNWVYYTGNAVTFPSGKYMVDGMLVNYYSERNGYRMPDYHRMDIGINWKNKPFKKVRKNGETVEVKRKFESSWNFSVYNLYGRENAYSIDFRQSEQNPEKTEAVQIALFKIIPSITYNFKF